MTQQNAILNSLDSLDWDYIRHNFKRLESGNVKRQNFVRNSYLNKDNLTRCLENDILLALFYRNQKVQESAE
ncbi:hypothetical protein Q5V23_004415 [Vibrio fluvialis]|nr:hypothetical protein [Vibrio fluvialis]ELL4670521.1 hypothetical protein [Vibrio fluvialis]